MRHGRSEVLDPAAILWWSAEDVGDSDALRLRRPDTVGETDA